MSRWSGSPFEATVEGMPPSPDALTAEFERPGGLFQLLSTVRSRRIGVGYRVDSGELERHPVTGRELHQPAGPQQFVSARAPQPLSEDEMAMLAWATCGPNGIIAWEASVSGSFHQLTSTRGRTAPEPNNTLATDLLIVDDHGVHFYQPSPDGQWPTAADPVTPEQVRRYWRSDRTTILGQRPDLDFALRDPSFPDMPLLGTHQYNFNRPGSVWLLPVTDAGRLLSGLLDLFTGKRTYLVDEFSGGHPAGLERFVRAGLLTRPLPITTYEQGILRTSAYPAGCMVQNTRLAAEALGLGAWCLSGYDQDVVIGGHPEISTGLGFTVGAVNVRAPLSTGRRHTHGIAGVKTSTCVPSASFPDAHSLVQHWHHERYGPGSWADESHGTLLGAQSPWPPERGAAIATDPQTRLPDWAWDAAEAYIDYCVQTFGQFPVTYDPMLAGFGTIVHHLDPDFYNRHLRPGYITTSAANHQHKWHPRHNL